MYGSKLNRIMFWLGLGIDIKVLGLGIYIYICYFRVRARVFWERLIFMRLGLGFGLAFRRVF